MSVLVRKLIIERPGVNRCSIAFVIPGSRYDVEVIPPEPDEERNIEIENFNLILQGEIMSCGYTIGDRNKSNRYSHTIIDVFKEGGDHGYFIGEIKELRLICRSYNSVLAVKANCIID